MVALRLPSTGVDLQALFPLALARVQLHLDPLQLAQWMQEVIQLRGQAQGNPEPGCAWTGDINGLWQLHRQPLFEPLVAAVAEQAQAYIAALGFDQSQVELHIQRSWPVVSAPDQAIGRHHHPNAHLSAIVYLTGDGTGASGCLRLFAPHNLNELVPGLAVGHGGPLQQQESAAQRWNAPWIDIPPSAGLLLLFPAALDHAVTANTSSDEERLSIAFDLALTAPEGTVPPEYLAPHPSQWDSLRQDGPLSK